MIDLFYPYVTQDMRDAVNEVLHSRFVGQGPKVDLFEKEFSKLFNLKHVASLSSGTAALETAYDLIGLKEGDEVISTPLTCTATNLPLLRKKIKIVWADILESTLCIDPLDVHSKITPHTKAVVQVHVGGIKADVGKLHIPVVSDACQALGIFNGDYTCCSFQAIKHITTGDGGMLVLNTANPERDRNNARLLRWFGIDRSKKIRNNWQAYRERKMTFDIKLPGTKRHMNDIAASMGIAALSHYQEVIDHRRKIFNIYKAGLKGVGGIKLVDGLDNTYWLATVLVENRDDFAQAMFEADIDTNLVQVRNDIYAVFGGVRQDLPVMNKLESKYISIPLTMNTTEDDANYIIDTIKQGW